MVHIENIVGAGSFGREFDLGSIAEDIDPEVAEASYDPSKSHWLRISMGEDVRLQILYASGSYIIVGAKSEEELYESREELLKLLDEMTVIEEPDDEEFEVVNIVCTHHFDFDDSLSPEEQTINLNALAIAFGVENIEYEPEQFPGLIYRVEETSCVVILFSSGKMVITGGRNIEDVEKTVEAITERVDSYLNVL